MGNKTGGKGYGVTRSGKKVARSTQGERDANIARQARSKARGANRANSARVSSANSGQTGLTYGRKGN